MPLQVAGETRCAGDRGRVGTIEHARGSYRKQVQQLKRLLTEKTLEVDFFKGALQKIEARRQKSGASGATASTTRSEK